MVRDRIAIDQRGVSLFTNEAASYSVSLCYEAGLRFMSHLGRWTRDEAELRIHEVLDDAKSGRLQKIVDGAGRFEIRYISDKASQTTGQLLSKGGPIDK